MGKNNSSWTLSIGNILAAVVSYSVNKSIFWAFIHCLCGWFYIIYYLIVRQ